MFPIGDEPNSRTFPLVNYFLIAANIVVFLFISLPLTHQTPSLNDPALREYVQFMIARFPGISVREILLQTSNYDVFTFKYGFKPSNPQILTLFTSLFMHAGFLHLLGNMLFLWVFGDNIEARLGRIRYLLLYLGTGIAATLAFSLVAGNSSGPLIGASGAISGILGAYFWWFPRNYVRLLIFLFIYIDIWRIPARWVLAFYVLVDNLLPFLSGNSSEGVAYGAHLGGFAAGLLAAMILGRQEDEPSNYHKPPPFSSSREVPSLRQLVEAEQYLDAGNTYMHMSNTQRAHERDDTVLALASGLDKEGESEAALAVLQSFIANRPQSTMLAEAHYFTAIIHIEHTGRLLAAREHLLSVLDLQPSVSLAMSARQALAAVDDALH
ncbi:MAG: rhomboid family intramembrane serine protease [Deltaproteobacteria bacterium]|nr:rhomboid family intramembrane serine protease [Deltaproteobacteria bacterium]